MTKDQDPSTEVFAPSGQVEGAGEGPTGVAGPEGAEDANRGDAGAEGGDGGTAGSGEGPELLSRDALIAALEEARREAEANHGELLRARAETVNLRRRAERDVENAHRYGVEKLIGELLPVIDSLELGLQAASSAETGAGVDKLREGTELTLRMLLAAAGKFGVEQIDPQGERFDPALHQAMSMQPAPPGGEANRVLTVYQKGYLLNERLVRPAMVVVSGPPEGAPEGDGGAPGGRIDELA